MSKALFPFGNLKDSRQIAAISLRAHQNMSLSYGDVKDSLLHRDHFLKELGINYKNLVCAKQVHGSTVRYIKEEDLGRGALSYDTAIPRTDALVTDKKNMPLAIFTADCLSVFLFDPVRPAVGLVHAGWRSSKENITAKTIEFMRDNFHTKAGDLYAGFGPSIKSCCYEVGAEFKNYFPEGIVKRGGRAYLDLSEVNKKQALSLGVDPAHIFDLKICTSCKSEELFSYRKEKDSSGRLMSVVMLK